MEKHQWASWRAASFRDWLLWMSWSPKQTTALKYECVCESMSERSLCVRACVRVLVGKRSFGFNGRQRFFTFMFTVFRIFLSKL